MNRKTSRLYGLSSGTDIITPLTNETANAGTTGKSPFNKVKVQTFDGNALWEMYKSQFNGWSEEAKAGNLVLGLRASAQQLLSNTAEKDKKKLPEASEESLQIFASNVIRLVHQAYLKATVQFRVLNKPPWALL